MEVYVDRFENLIVDMGIFFYVVECDMVWIVGRMNFGDCFDNMRKIFVG